MAVTLWESTTLTTPYYLFELISKQTKVKQYFTATDISTNIERFNLFLVTVKANPNPLVGEVNLIVGDEYDYIIREQVSPTNLDPVNAGAIVERGIMTYNIPLPIRNKRVTNDNTRAVYKG